MADAGGISTDLADEPSFELATLRVFPSQGKAVAGGAEARVEPRVMQVLLVLRRSAGETVTRDRLIEACWNGRAVSDDAVARAIAKVRQLGRLGGETHFTIETVPKVGFRLDAQNPPKTALEPPPAAPHEAAPWPRFTVKRIWIALCAAIGVLAAAAFVFASTRRQEQHVAITPFTVIGAAPEATHVAGRLGPSLARHLPGRSLLTGNATSGSFRRKPDLALTGTVERIDDRVVVSARIQHASGVVLWGGEFDRPAPFYVGLSEGAARAMGATLRCVFTEQDAAGRRFDAQTLSQWLRVCDAAIRNAPDVLDITRTLVRENGSLAGAHSLLALSAVLRTKWDGASREEGDALRAEAAAAAAAALNLNPKDSRAHVVLGLLASSFAERESQLRRALELAPESSLVRTQTLIFLRETGRLEEARRLGARTLNMSDPLLLSNLPHVAFLSAMAGDFATAEAATSEYETVFPTLGPSIRWTNTVWWEKPETALARMADFSEAATEPGECFTKVLTALAAGETIKPLPAACSALSVHWQARLLSRTGDVDGAFATLEEMEKTLPLTQLLFYPEMKTVRSDPRFEALAERLKLLPYWRETGRWPDFCGELDAPKLCPRS